MALSGRLFLYLFSLETARRKKFFSVLIFAFNVTPAYHRT
jgi:hypothetical protein